jgi:predicted Holliday junction resolvase-like endonuclease
MEFLFIGLAVISLIIAYAIHKSKQEDITRLELFVSDAKQQIHELTGKSTQLSGDMDLLSSKYQELLVDKAEVETVAREEARGLMELWKQEETKKIRKKTLDQSRAVLRGQAAENLAPFMIEGLEPGDMRFIGKPVDIICFDGCGAVNDGEANEINKIVLIDVKTNKSQLSKVQRRIRDAVNAGRVEFMTVRIGDNNE